MRRAFRDRSHPGGALTCGRAVCDDATAMTEDEQPRWGRWLLLGLIAVVLVVGAWLAKPAYRAWKKQRHLAQAAAFLAAGDHKNAALSARLALSLDPANVTAAEIMARLTRELRSPEALAWAQRVVELAPGRASNQIALAEVALSFGEAARAERALLGVATNDRNTVAFHQAAALTLAAQRRLSEAEAHLAAGLRLEPDNELLRLNHAVLLLQARDTNLALTGLRRLEQTATNSPHRRVVLQNLAEAYLQHQRPADAVAAARELGGATNAPFGDRMFYLNILRQAKSPGYSAELAAQQAAAERLGQEAVHALAAWMQSIGDTDGALRWLDGLPVELKNAPRVTMARADLLLARAEWAALQATLEAARWEERDFFRRALLARALREQRQTTGAAAEWLAATRAATGQPRLLAALARTAAEWGWADEERDLLWVLLERHPGERWVPGRLAELCHAAGDTRGLNRLYQTLFTRDPGDLTAKNNFAVTTLLLNPQSLRARELARELARAQPTNAYFASTLAFALWQAGDRAGALAAFAEIPPAEREQGGVALYYALALGTNAPAEARRHLELATTAPLLPEERALAGALRAELR